jgi:cysteate synthase
MTDALSPTKYTLRSVRTGHEFTDTGWVLDAPGESEPTLIRAVYDQKQIRVKGDDHGLYKFSDWLPVNRMLHGSSSPATFKSTGLAEALSLTNLVITFSGYWPERGALMRTCSFKETEAYSVCGRLDPLSEGVLVVASAGNTARSFARVCSENGIPLLLCMPEDTLDAMWFDAPVNDCVRLVVTRSGSDYFDAIHLSNLICKLDGFFPEGGAKNIARRDGMATTVLSAVTAVGRIPEYYFQAVGSGTGAIAAWEANLRLIEDGRFGQRKMKLMVSQNCPFIPMYDSWKAHSRELLPLDEHTARNHVREISAKVLSNRRPPYSIAGGLFDALTDSGGDFLKVTNPEAFAAGELFMKTEGVSLHPAASVAVASLVHAVKSHLVEQDALIMLNITGGGEEEFKKEHTLYYLKPSVVFEIDPHPETVRESLKELF